ncbi:hypothetical protein [Microcoleus sp. PH2017_08_TRC_O_A]|uniref:hypothetical protein n=1 Tax=Microcoleus sp. PH2017_08_TRC_O_A TaxID=2798819 RepID=UPI001DB034D1|nr:hypothetical protein [Microcoleus sp. PH2017_08_TRC_O_A]MCC3453787.1 hypothetical protein [Microcoleus sp. PH2017_08_TRC_O_A]
MDKPALSPPTTYINLKFASHRKIVHDDLSLGGGGFFRLFISGDYLTIINNLDKPALSPPTTYINLKFASHRKIVHDDLSLGWGGFLRLFVSGDYCW